MNKRNITPIPSKNNTPNLPDGKNWREFLGKKHIDVGSRIRDDEQGKMHQEHYVKDLFKPSIDYPISEEEWEEIWKGNGVLRDSIIKDILFHPECINTQSTDEQSRRECLGTKYLEIRNGKVRDPRNPNIWHLISEEDRIEIETVNKVYDLHEERISDQQLHEAGMKNYLTNSLSLGYLRSNYREQVFTALQEENLTLHAIPEFLEEQKQPPTLPVPLFTGIAKKEKVDHYEKSILDFFKKYEHHSLENLYIRDREIIDTEHAFVKGHIDKGKLLQRTYTFQAIQQRNFIQFYKRMYRYGREYGSRGFKEKPPIRKTINCMGSIHDFLEKKGGTLQDLDETPENFKERIKETYKRKVNECKFNDEVHFKGYGNIREYEYTILDINREDLQQREQEAKAEWKDFCREKMKERIHIDKEINVYTNTRTKARGYERTVNRAIGELEEIKKLYQKTARAKRLIEEEIKDEYREDEFDANDQEKMIDILQDYIAIGIEKLKNKERIKAMTNKMIVLDDFKEWEKHYQITKRFNKDMGFAYVLSGLINQKAEMLKILNPQHPLLQSRSENQDRYVKEYLEYCDTAFLTNRIKNILSENLSFGTGELVDREKLMEEMSPKIIKAGKETLYNNLKKRIPNQISTFSTLLPRDSRRILNQAITFPIPLHRAMISATTCLFPSGHATALKFLYPKEEERISIRQYFLQTISKELLTEIESRLLSETEFSPIEYCMREPLLYIYKRYGGREELGVDASIIKEKYYAHQKKTYEHLLDGWEEKIGNPKNTDKLYEEIIGMTLLIKQYTFFFLKNTPTHIQRTPKKGMKKEYENIFRKNDYDSTVAQQLSPDIEEIYRNLRDERKNIKNLILQKILQQRTKQNFAGRVKRIIEQTIQKKFGTITISPEQTKFIIAYLKSILEDIIMSDISHTKNFFHLYAEDKDMLKQYIKESLSNLENFLFLEKEKAFIKSGEDLPSPLLPEGPKES